MSYDLHGHWDSTTGTVAPLYPRSGESGAEREFNVVRLVDWLWHVFLCHSLNVIPY